MGPVQRAQGGRYTCTAFNELGNIKAEGERGLSQLWYLNYLKTFSFAAHLNVLFKPECTINKKVQDQVLYLSCQVEAFPPNVTYFWYHNEKLISCEYKPDIEYKLDSLSLCTSSLLIRLLNISLRSSIIVTRENTKLKFSEILQNWV